MPLFVCVLFMLANIFAFGDDIIEKDCGGEKTQILKEGESKPLEKYYPYLRSFSYNGPGHIEIQQGSENKIIFKASEKMQNKFNLNYANGALEIEPKNVKDLSCISEIPHIVLIANELQKIFLEGDNIVDINSLKTESLMVEIKVNGSTMLEANIDCERFAVSMVGSSQATVRGKAQYQTININGPSLYDGKDLLTTNTNVQLLGASSCLVNVKKNLSISIEGFGHVHYLGSPKVSKKIKGEGLVSPLTKDVIEQFEEKK